MLSVRECRERARVAHGEPYETQPLSGGSYTGYLYEGDGIRIAKGSIHAEPRSSWRTGSDDQIPILSTSLRLMSSFLRSYSPVVLALA
jgi:hypothetical protein